MSHELGEVMLERDFQAHDSNGNVLQVKLQVGKPQLKPETNSKWRWYCPHQIIGINSEAVHRISGLDAMDALLTTLKLAHIRLKDYERTDNKKITWIGEDDLGLPKIESSDVDLEGFAGFAGFEEIFEKFFQNLNNDKDIKP